MPRRALPRERRMEWTERNGRLVRTGGTTEVAVDLGVQTSNVTTWVNRKKIGANGEPPPAPIDPPYAMGPLYDLDAWRIWHGVAPEQPPVAAAT